MERGFSVKHSVRGFVIELLFDGVPFQFTAQAHADVPGLADGDSTMRHFCVTGRQLAVWIARMRIAHMIGSISPTRAPRTTKTEN